MQGSELTTAMANFWMLDWSKRDTPDEFAWRELPAWPGPSRALNITATQHDGFHDGIYVMSGRREDAGGIEFLTDVWEYVPALDEWKSRAETPRPIMAGMGIGWGQSHIFVLGGADGSMFDKADVLKDDHPGFPKEAFAYHTITDTWTSAGALPANHVTTVPVQWGDRMIIASGEVRPRVRSPKIWAFHAVPGAAPFGAVNYAVLVVYLLAMVGIGVYFATKNKDTDDYFRGGKQMAWWAAGCSIFATMLSSLTYTGVPSKAFAQNWVYMVGNFMILGVAPIAIYIALPFFRQIDATSAYEYLEKRFNRHVRLFGSASFTLFHIFRMAVVMSLTGYALAAATPLSPVQSVLIMGVLSIVYCTIGGGRGRDLDRYRADLRVVRRRAACVRDLDRRNRRWVRRVRVDGVGAWKVPDGESRLRSGQLHAHGDLGGVVWRIRPEPQFVHGRPGRRATLYDHAPTNDARDARSG